MKRKILIPILVIFALNTQTVSAQSTSQSATPAAIERPKLVVGLVIDQMRWDFLYRYNAKYTSTGFNRLLRQGFSFENTLIPFTPTYTAAGHACIYTGSIPAIHGIMGNNWYDKTSGRNVYCTDDSTVTTVGSNSRAGKMSPRNMWTTTITDELRLSNNFQSKVIGIALKDRGAILPAGHSGNAAYWYDESVGKFITSSYYMKALPKWVDDFNKQDLPAKYMKADWNTLYPIKEYTLSTADDKIYEYPLSDEKQPVFPHKVSQVTDGIYSTFKFTPYANTYTFDFAKKAIESEKMGKGSVTDFLAVSISSTDYIGHSFGPNSVEIEDTYYRLDKDIADFLDYLDATVGKNNYLLILSADHGVAHVPAFLKEHNLPGDVFDDFLMLKEINTILEQQFGLKNILQSVMNYQFYINTAEVERNGKDLAAIKRMVIKSLLTRPFIINAFETAAISGATLPEPQKTMMTNGYNPKRSGDIMFTVKPGYFDGGIKGTTHGLWNPYDAHIPNVWYGWHVPHGQTSRETYMTDIAPTIAAMLKIQEPNGNAGKVLTELTK